MLSRFRLKVALAIVPFFIAVPSEAAECDLAAISDALDASLANMKPYERDVAEQLSTEGGVWEIYREKDGRLNTVIRIDAGESGRNDTRLSVVNRNTWGIASTRSDYNRHAFAEGGGPFAIVRKTTTLYFFCDGKLYMPPDQWSTVGEDYVKAGAEAKDTFFKAGEISEFVKGLTR